MALHRLSLALADTSGTWKHPAVPALLLQPATKQYHVCCHGLTSTQRKLCVPGHCITLIQDHQLEFVAAVAIRMQTQDAQDMFSMVMG
jgi:hypothetical protein